MDQLGVFLKKNKGTLCLLAAPFNISFVHETIHLKKKELLEADQQILSLSRLPLDKRAVKSIQLSEKKAITIHSHLTEEGAKLLSSIKKLGKGVQWQPAISFIMGNLLGYPQELLREKTCLRCFLEQEAFEIIWSSTIPHVQLIQNWLPVGKIEDKVPYFKSLLQTREEDERDVV